MAYHLARSGVRVTIIEKEHSPALHQSGRNSGVIHAGYNLKPGSAKARYCVEGSRRLRAYCTERGIAMTQGGILVVARTETECMTLAELARRSVANGVQARLVDQRELREIEPATLGLQGLHAPEGASFDAAGYVAALLQDAVMAGATIHYDTRVTAVHDAAVAAPRSGPITLATTRGPVDAAVLVSCGGLYADRLAGPLASDVRVIPFRGYYAELRSERRGLVRSHIYSAPDLTYPFLGVHLSRRADGRVLVGPGAMLAFGREAYGFWGVNWGDLAGTVTWPGFRRLLGDRRFRSLVRGEVAKSLSLRAIWEEARLLVPALEPGDLVRSFAGNRAQLVDRAGTLIDDLVVRETPNALHVLNAVSPGLTCSLPLGEDLAKRAVDKLKTH